MVTFVPNDARVAVYSCSIYTSAGDDDVAEVLVVLSAADAGLFVTATSHQLASRLIGGALGLDGQLGVFLYPDAVIGVEGLVVAEDHLRSLQR